MKFPAPNIASYISVPTFLATLFSYTPYSTGYSSLDLRHQVLHYVKQKVQLCFIFEYPH